ncbi:MAG: lipoprotein [Eubacterium sp.]
MMKKIIPLFLLVLVLSGCAAKIYTPVINTEFELNAVYHTGDFSYNCLIVKDESSLSITPTTTNAAGMSITYNGADVTFNKDGMKKTISADKINNTNPAIVLYEVFNYIETTEDLSVERVDDSFQYTGKTSLGNFILVQNKDNSFDYIEFPNADISIVF